MKKKIIVILLLVSLMFMLCGCETSADLLATKVNNTIAYIKVNEKTITVDVKEYLYGSNGVAIIYGTDGKTYKTHSMNVVLVKEKENEQIH